MILSNLDGTSEETIQPHRRAVSVPASSNELFVIDGVPSVSFLNNEMQVGDSQSSTW